MDPTVKKILNNSGFIAHLAPLLDGPEASALAASARAYRAILRDLEITIDTEGFDGCAEAQQLVKWCRGIEEPNPDEMNEWTASIWSAIADLADGNLPT